MTCATRKKSHDSALKDGKRGMKKIYMNIKHRAYDTEAGGDGGEIEVLPFFPDIFFF